MVCTMRIKNNGTNDLSMFDFYPMYACCITAHDGQLSDEKIMFEQVQVWAWNYYTNIS